MEELLEYPEIENMYKYRLLQELEKVYITELKINEINQRCARSASSARYSARYTAWLGIDIVNHPLCPNDNCQC